MATFKTTGPKKSASISESEIGLRDSLFPGCEARLWEKTRDQGFVTIPKTMPFIKRILNEMSKNQPLGEVYEILWTYTWNNNGFVRLGKLSEMAFAAGFKQQRGERTFRERLKRLSELGFVELKPHAGDSFGFAFLPNPHEVILTLHAKREAATLAERAQLPYLSDDSFNTFLVRAYDIKAADIKAIQKRQLGEQNSSGNEPTSKGWKKRLPGDAKPAKSN